MDTQVLIKLIGAVMVIVSSSAAGVMHALSYKERVEAIMDFRKRLHILKDEIRFRHGVIGDAFERIGEEKGPFSTFFKDTAIYLRTMDSMSAWDLSCDALENRFSLKEEDIQIIRLLGNELGKSDLEGQLSYIDSVDARLKKQEEDAEKLREKNEPLFKKVGVLVGVGIAIVLM